MYTLKLRELGVPVPDATATLKFRLARKDVLVKVKTISTLFLRMVFPMLLK